MSPVTFMVSISTPSYYVFHVLILFYFLLLSVAVSHKSFIFPLVTY